MTRVVLAGSENLVSVSVIDFTNPAAVPPALLVPPGVGAGSTVDLSLTLGAIGGLQEPAGIQGIDVTDPAAPKLLPVAPTKLSGIGAVAVNGTLAAGGEFDGERVVLVDLTTGTVLATAPTLVNQVTSVGFCGPRLVVAAGNSFGVALIDFSASPPVVTEVSPGLGAPLVVAADPAAGLFAVGDTTGPQAILYDAAGIVQARVADACPDGTFSIGLCAYRALYGSTNSFDAYLIDFSAETSTAFPDGLNGSATVNMDCAGDGVCGLVSGGGPSSSVALFDLNDSPPTMLATQDSQLPSIGSIAVSYFTPVAGWSPATLAFGTIAVGFPEALMLSVTNAGTSPLAVTAVSVGAAAVFTSAPGALTVPPGQVGAITVTFMPKAITSYSGTLTFQTNDPSHPDVSIPMTGAGGEPAASWAPAALDFGIVAVGTPQGLTLSVTNTGNVPLAVTAVSASPGAVFTSAPGALTVPPGRAGAITVAFKPTATTSYSGLLTFQTDDPSHPDVTIQLSGAGGEPAASWTPSTLDFGTIALNGTSTRTLAVTNSGTVSLHVTDVSSTTSSRPPSASFAVSGAPLAVLPGETGSLGITLSPMLVWPWGYQVTAELVFDTDDPAHPTGTVPMSGSVEQLGCLGAPGALAARAWRAVAGRLPNGRSRASG
jgi:hypothetical protein